MKRPLISDEWAREYQDPEASGIVNGIMLTPYTFCGALEELYGRVSRDWNNDTKAKYDKDYNNTILPHIEHHNEKLISSYTKEDCETILDSIKKEGYIKNGETKKYSVSQMNHYKYLLYTVFKHASLNGWCHDFLWGTKFEIHEEREELEIRSKTRIKKSLSVNQEKRIVENLMQYPQEDGRLIALLLMFSLGLRDGEACGLDFGDIYKLPYYEDCYVAIIRQSTIPKTNIVQSGGKTWNAGRRIPIPSKVLDFIFERKRTIETIIVEEKLDLDINKVPVACDGHISRGVDFSKRLRADNLAEHARSVFKDAGVSSEILSLTEIEIEEKNARLEVSERNATAYVLRRNFATHLKILGVDYPDIQYLLGHCIEDPYLERSDYTNNKLYSLSELMSNRQLLNYERENRVSICKNSEMYFSGDEIININCNAAVVKLNIFAMEKDDVLKIKNLSKDENIQIDFYENYMAYKPHRGIDILKKYKADYE